MTDINEAVEIASRGYDNTLNNAERILVDAYIQVVLEDEKHIEDFKWVHDITVIFEEILHKLR